MVDTSSDAESRLRKDFVAFLSYMFNQMGLPRPTPMQRLFADILQKNPSRRLVILAYRGFAKTTIANLYLIWELWNNDQLQMSVWGQNMDFAADSVGQMLKWVQTTGILKTLCPGRDQQQSTMGFDTPGKPSHMRGASVSALSIGGGITGSRADLLFIDDPETTQNGYTQQKRENLDRQLSEAVNVIKEKTGRIIIAGTPHFDRSLYTRLKAKGYKIYIFPITVPPKHVADACWEHYPQQVKDAIQTQPEGTCLDRFSQEEIGMRMAEGKISYERQNLLNIYRVQGADRPLDLTRVILYDANTRSFPHSLEHAREPQYVAADMASYSCADVGEHLYRPFRVSETSTKYEAKILYVDPSGAGKDEMVSVSAGAASGYMVVFNVTGYRGGVSQENLEQIISQALRIGATTIFWESNLSAGAEWCRAVLDAKFAPRYGRKNLPQVVEVHNQVSKENRIVHTLDPIINGGRLVITPEALMSDFQTAEDRGTEGFQDFTLTAQISNFCPGQKLPVDDRIDALAGAGAKLTSYLSIAPMAHAENTTYELLKEILERPMVEGTKISSTPPDGAANGHRNRFLRNTKRKGAIGALWEARKIREASGTIEIRPGEWNSLGREEAEVPDSEMQSGLG